MKNEDRLSVVFENEAARRKLRDVGYFVGDLENSWGYTSGILLKLGLTDEDMRSGVYQQRIHPDDLPNYMHNWNRLNNGHTHEMYCEYRVADSEGRWRWIETHAVVLERSADGGIGKVAGFDRNIDVRKQAEEVLQQKQLETQRKLAISEAMRRVGADITLDRDLKQVLEHAVRQIAEVISFHSCEVYTQQKTEMSCVFAISLNGSSAVTTDKDVAGKFIENVSESLYPIILDTPESPYDGYSLLLVPLRVRNRFVGTLFLWRSSEQAFSGDDLYPALALTDSLAAAVYNRSYYQEQVNLLEQDGLTGFLTRSVFERNVPQLWAEYRSLYAHNSVAIIDIDNFKSINDTFGHAKGDKIIRELAQLLRDGLRREDLLVRYGGEEFVAIFPNTDIDTATKTVDRIRSACTQSDAFELEYPLSFSAGLAECFNDDIDLPSLITMADTALYSAKHAGRNQVHQAPLQSKRS